MYITYLIKFFKSPIFRLIFIIGCVAAIVSLSTTLYSLWQRQDILRGREAVKAQKELENAQLKKQLDETKTDFFVEREARNKLGLGKEGEVTILMPKVEISQAPSDQISPDTKSVQTEPNWKKWWRLFY